MTHETVSVSVQPVMRSRREFLKLSGMAALSVGGMMFLAGCGPAPQGSGDAADGGASASGTLLGDGKTLRVGMEAAYAPYNWQVSEESEFTIPIENVPGAYADGYDVQVAKIIADGLGMEPVAVKLEFGSLIDALNNGQVDIVCAGMSVTPERAAAAAFSDSYVDDDIVMICRADSAYAGATTFDELADASILGQAATMYDDVIAQIEGANHMTPAETQPMVVENLRNGTCDIITYSMLSAPKLLEVYPDLVVLDMEDAFEGSLMPDNAGVAKGNDAALDKVNEIIASIDDEERQDMWSACMDRQPNGSCRLSADIISSGVVALRFTKRPSRICPSSGYVHVAVPPIHARRPYHVTQLKESIYDHRIGGRGSAWPLGLVYSQRSSLRAVGHERHRRRGYGIVRLAPSLFELYGPCICA